MKQVVITISRHYGSGGKTVGEMLAKRLNIPCYDRNIMRLASDISGIDEGMFGEVDEKLKSSSLFRISSNIYKGQLIPPESDEFVSNDNLFNYQAKVIKELAKEESCVIIGRCADFVLKDMHHVVRVFVHAPDQFCFEKAMEVNGGSEKDVEKLITKTNKYRADYYAYYTGKQWNDARNYDLCLDSSKLGFEKCVEEILAYINIRFSE
jgi:cytidylate kinase